MLDLCGPNEILIRAIINIVFKRSKDPGYESTGMPQIKPIGKVVESKGGKCIQAIRKLFPRINTITVSNLLGYNIYLVNYYLIGLLIKQFQNSIFPVLYFYIDTFIIIFQRTNLHYIAHINNHEILHQILKPRYL